MEDGISCDDPQFMNMLETCLRVEIETAKGTLSGLESKIKEFKSKIQTGLQTRRDLKGNTKNAQENISILTSTLDKQNKYSNELSQRIELTTLNLDNDYKAMKVECEKYREIYTQYEKTWESYHTKYEEFPLAKERMEAKVKLKKVEVEKMVIEYKIEEFKKIKLQQESITWLKMRAQIVELARAFSNSSKLDRQLNELNNEIRNGQDELNKLKLELAVKIRRQEEEKRERALRLLEMPPPRINFSHMRRIYGPRTGFLDGWKRNENSIDTLSVDTLVLEEMCREEEITDLRCRVETQEEEGKVCNSEPIDGRSRSLGQQEQPEVEHEDAASQVDENAGPDAIDAHIEEMEHRVDRELEHFEQPSGLPEDKQTEQRSQDYTERLDDPVAKKIRLISVERKLADSPIKNVQLERKRNMLTVQSDGPKITRIEAVNYDLSSIKNTSAKGNQSVEQSSSKKQKLDKPNPSSMFTPRYYDYSDNSNLSFILEKNISDLKDDQISLYGGSVRDFCECIGTPTSNEHAREIPAVESNANVPSTTKNLSFPRFDFSNILKKSSSRNNLF